MYDELAESAWALSKTTVVNNGTEDGISWEADPGDAISNVVRIYLVRLDLRLRSSGLLKMGRSEVAVPGVVPICQLLSSRRPVNPTRSELLRGARMTSPGSGRKSPFPIPGFVLRLSWILLDGINSQYESTNLKESVFSHSQGGGTLLWVEILVSASVNRGSSLSSSRPGFRANDPIQRASKRH